MIKSAMGEYWDPLSDNIAPWKDVRQMQEEDENKKVQKVVEAEHSMVVRAYKLLGEISEKDGDENFRRAARAGRVAIENAMGIAVINRRAEKKQG